MTTSITDGTTTVTPDLITAYASTNVARNIFHIVLGAESEDVNLIPASLRTGTITYQIADTTDAFAALALHNDPAGPLSLTSTDIAAVDMVYLPSGNIVLTLDPDTAAMWLLAVDFHEVSS